MLVLSRKIGQRILIGEGIELEVLEVRGNRIKLGINAPADISIHRAETFASLRQQTESGTSNIAVSNCHKAE